MHSPEDGLIRLFVFTAFALAALSSSASAQIQRQGQTFGVRPEIQTPENDARNIVVKRKKSCEDQADAQDLTGDTRQVFLETCQELRGDKQD